MQGSDDDKTARGPDRREGDRRKRDLPYPGPDRRKTDRRDGKDRRGSDG